MISDPPEIELRCGPDGESFTFTPSAKLWLDLQAFCAASGLTIEAVITRALGEFLPRVRGRDARRR